LVLLRQFADSKADTAVLHHAQKDGLFLGRVIRPDEQLKILPAKTSVASEQWQNLFPVEEGVDCLQSPILVEDDAIAKESGSVEYHAIVVQEIEQGVFVANTANFVADAVKFRSLQQTMLSLGRLAFLVFFEHRSQPVTHL
jgi:hypothetical protein